ncbi:hypothetical protein NQ314_000880 [Rhamnusium bicolor]|uniref:ISXO2-like transposase domain-containing protein n=1 Tax=Rhamnusium bicolor TaxID=1586634 RepID=A0AAV8ZU22_9CUCU|nr:hypothetical protein NQ314_000880 [Rhamnusium bicolor]
MEYKPPRPFDIDESCMWPKWKQKFNIFLKASGKHSSEEDVKIALLLHIIGDTGLDIYNTFPETKVATLTEVLNCFDAYFLPKTNVTMETFKFNNISQKEDQNIDSFITELKKQAANCAFICENDNCKRSYMERMIKDRVILGLNDKQVQQRLIRETNMTLEKTQEYCKSIELSKQHIKLLAPEEEVNIIKTTYNCKQCGNHHQRGKCPAFNKTCAVCQKKNHFAKMCYFKGRERKEARDPQENLDDADRLISFLQQHGVLLLGVDCPQCNKPCKLYSKPQLTFRCTNTIVKVNSNRKKTKVTCSYAAGAKKGTFFEHSRLPMNTICHFVALWLTFNHPRQTYIEHELQLSSSTVVDWSNFCREVCIACIVDASECIGGPGIVVEIDEAKMGKRKYNRGRIIDGQWVFGGFERESKKCFFVPVENRTKDTARNYSKHEAVNHSKNFVDSDTGAHTQNIERCWRDVRAGIPRFGRREQHFDGYLAEYQFRKKYPDHRDRFHHFFKCIGQVYPPAVSNFGEDSAGSD